MTRTITTAALGLALGGLLLAGCGTTSPASSANSSGALTTTAEASRSGSAVSPGVTLQDTHWELHRYERRTPAGVLTGNAPAGTETTMVLTDGRITFEGLCNGANGEVTVSDTT